MTISDRILHSQPLDGLSHNLEMASKPPRLRRQLAPDDPPPSNSGGVKFGPLPVSALAGLIAAAFAIFVLGVWLTVVLIRRKRRRATAARRRQRGSVADEEADSKQKIPDTTGPVERHSLSRNIKSSTQYLPTEQTPDDFKYDPSTPLESSTRVLSSQDQANKFGNSNLTQSIVLPSLSPGYSQGEGTPYSAQSSSWNTPPSSGLLYSSPNPTTSKSSAPTSPLRNNSRNTTTPLYSVGPASSSRPSLRARAPSQLSKSFSIVEPEEVADMPELPSDHPLTSKKAADAHRPRKLEKKRRSGSLRRRDSRSKERNATSDEDMQEKGKGLAEKMPQIHLRHASSQLPLSDSDQSSRTIVPTKVPKSPITAAANPPTSFNSNPPTLTRQRSGIRQPGDANHLRPPKDGSPTYGSGSLGPLSLLASSSENSHGTLAPLLNPSMQLSAVPGASALLSEPPHGKGAARPQPSPRPWQGQQPLFATSADNEVLAFHKAAGNVPKPFKPFAFQFPQRSPVISNASNTRTTGSNNNMDNGSTNAGHFAALVAAAGLSVSPTNSPSPSPLGRSTTPGSNVIGRASNDGLSAMPWRPSTDGLTSFPPRSSTDALNNFGNPERRGSLQSGYSVEVPWDQDGVPPASSPSAFSFSTDLYGYGGPGPASTSNSIDLYRRVDPTTLFPGNTLPTTGLGGVDIEGRHSLSLLGGEPLSPAELDSRGLRMRRFREGHASVSSFAAFTGPAAEEGRSTRTPSWTLEALRENLFGASSAHRRGQDSVTSSSVGSQSRRSSMSPYVTLGVPVGPPALASPRDVNFQFPVSQGANGLGSSYPATPWNHQPAGTPNHSNLIPESLNSSSESRMKTVVRSFAPLLPDELVLRPGEELAVLQEFDDGWCVVAREGLGSNGAPTPPGLPDPEDIIPQTGDASSSTGSSASSRRRVLEVGTCPSWVFEEASFNGEFTRPMRSTSLGITVSMRLPPAPNSILGGNIRESPTSTNAPLAPFGHTQGNDSLSLNRSMRGPAPIREEVVSWSNF